MLRPGGSVIKRLVFIFIWLLAAIFPVAAQEQAAALPEIVGVRASTTPERARLVVDVSAPTQFALASLADPMQIAVDLRVGGMRDGLASAPAGEGLIGGFSLEMAEENRARVWLKLTGPAKVSHAYFLEAVDDQPARLVVDMVPASEAEFAALAARDLQSAVARLEQPAPASGPPAVTEQAKPLIVIDPGHGGADSGAEAANGVKEKDIVLAFSKILQKMLVETGKFDVALTREDDVFLRLEDRVLLARQNKADLFVSIHADYFQQPEASGASIYTRDERATDVLDKVLAEQENRVDLIGGFAVPQMQDSVVNILVDLMRREMRRQSYQVAQAIVDEMEPDVRLRRFPVRKANFFVLQAPDVPSILVELGFMSNASDISNLTTEAWRDKVAEALARGITHYFDDFEQR